MFFKKVYGPVQRTQLTVTLDVLLKKKEKCLWKKQLQLIFSLLHESKNYPSISQLEEGKGKAVKLAQRKQVFSVCVCGTGGVTFDLNRPELILIHF